MYTGGDRAYIFAHGSAANNTDKPVSHLVAHSALWVRAEEALCVFSSGSLLLKSPVHATKELLIASSHENLMYKKRPQ